MQRSQLVPIVRNLLPPDTSWPNNQLNFRLKDRKTVLMLVATVPDRRLAVKLIDLVRPVTEDLWARDVWDRHVIMDACYHGAHPSVLLRLVKWARKNHLNMIALMSTQDIDGLDAVELAIREGHGALVSCLLGHRVPESYSASLCPHYPLEVLELAIETRNEECVKVLLTNKRFVNDLQPGLTERLNLRVRWMQCQTDKKRLFNLYTCVAAAVRCDMATVIPVFYQINPYETHEAVWYAVNKLRAADAVALPLGIRRMARSYLLDKSWPQLSVILVLREWKVVAREEHSRSPWEQLRRFIKCGHRDWDAIASHPWTTLPNEMIARILCFLLPSERSEMNKMEVLVEY